MKANLWKTAFNGGELSPRLSARTDQVKYGSGGSMMQNFIPTVQGPIIRRGGTQYIVPVQNSLNRTWLMPFKFNTVNSYTLEFGNKYIRFYTNRGPVSDISATITAISAGTPGVFTAAMHGFSNGNIVQLTGIVGPSQLNNQYFTIAGATTNTFTLLDIYGAPVNTNTMPIYVSGGTAARLYQITSPYNVADLTDSTGRFLLTFYQSNDVIYIAHGSYPLQILSRTANTSWSIAPAGLKNGPFQTKNSNQTQNIYCTPTTASVSGAASNGAPNLIRLHVATTGIVTGNTIEVFGITGTVEANGVWAVNVIDSTHLDLIGSAFTNNYISGGTIIGRDGTVITLTSNSTIFSAVGADELFYIQSPITNNLPQWAPGVSITLGTRYQSGLNTYIALNSATTGTNTPIHTIGAQYDGSGSGGVQWLFEDSGWGCIQLTAINSTSTATGTIQISPPNACSLASNPTYLWAHGAFGSVQGYPNVVTIMNDRLILFGGIQCMGSVSDDYLNFAPLIGGQQTADSSFVITMPVTSPAQWATPHNDLLVGTKDQELIITKINQTQALGPTNITALKQTAHGSVRCDATTIEFFNMFVNKSGQQIRQQVYNWMVSGYIANDMTLFGEHLPKGPDGKQGIVQVAWAQDPDYLMWCCTTDGRLITFSFHSEQEVTAWHNHPIGGSDTQAPLAAKGFKNAVVESVCSIPSPDGSCDDLWMIVKRTVNGQEMRFVEYVTQYFTDIPANIANAFYIDSGLTYIGTPAKKIYGFDHLKGQTLDILLNGGPINQVIVANDGSVTLPFLPPGASMTLQAGLPCWARFIGMRPEGGARIGTAQTLLKKINQIAVRLLNSLGFSYGDPNLGESTFIPVSVMTAGQQMDQAIQPYTGDKGRPGIDAMNFPQGTNTDAFIEILVNQPVPVTICGMMAALDLAE